MEISSAWAPTSATSASDSAYICSRAGRFLSELDELAFVMSVCIAWLQSFAARGDPMLGSEQEVQVIRTSYFYIGPVLGSTNAGRSVGIGFL